MILSDALDTQNSSQNDPLDINLDDLRKLIEIGNRMSLVVAYDNRALFTEWVRLKQALNIGEGLRAYNSRCVRKINKAQ